jgi:glycine hydroxymethyltransferase
MHIIAAKAVAFFEALQPEFKVYCQNVLNNAQILSNGLMQRGYDIFTGGTDNHLMLVDLRSAGITGKTAQYILGSVGVTCNKNTIPFDSQKPTITSGIRLGTPAGTTRGFAEKEYALIANLIADVLDQIHNEAEPQIDGLQSVALQVQALCAQFPLYS